MRLSHKRQQDEVPQLRTVMVEAVKVCYHVDPRNSVILSLGAISEGPNCMHNVYVHPYPL